MDALIVNECRMLSEKLISMRRELHKYPEIGGKLPKTREVVCRALDEMGISYNRG